MSKSSMTRLKLLFGVFLFSGVIAGAAEAQVNARAVKCPSDPSVTGYRSIADINQDQLDELSRIASSSVIASPPYSFVLCPNTNLEVWKEPLNIVLSGTIISCGSEMEASSSLGCVIQGGSSQVRLIDSTTTNYQLASVTIIGVTFELFNGTSIDVTASDALTVTLMDSVWKNFISDFVIRQQQPVDGSFPARVEVVGGAITNGMGGSMFSNDAGVLVLNHLSVTNITCAGLVSTSNGGVVMLRASMVSRSGIDTVASAMMGSTLSIIDMVVFDMVYTKKVFHVSDPRSSLILNRTTVRGIDSEGKWKGVVVDDSAHANLQKVQFTGNKRFESLVVGKNSAKIDVVECIFDSNTGSSGRGVWSTIVHALESSVVEISRTKFEENTKLAAVAMATRQSGVVIKQSCFMGGSSDEMVFRSKDSSTIVSENYVSRNAVSTTCPGGNIRLSVEHASSQCFEKGSTSCDTMCDMLADQAICVADLAQVTLGTGVTGRQANDTKPANSTTAATGETAPVANSTSSTTNTTLPGTGSPGSGEAVPPAGGNETSGLPNGGNGTETTTPTDSEGGMATFTTIYVAFEVTNDAMITDPAEVNASGLGDAFPVFVEEVVTNLTTTLRRQLIQHQRRRLAITLSPGSAIVYEIIPVGCVADNRTVTMNLTSDFSITCHEAMGKYDLLLTSEEDPSSVSDAYTLETRNRIDDGTFQRILLEVDPQSPLIVGPSIDPTIPETSIPIPTIPLFPTVPTVTSIMPSCPPLSPSSSKSKSKSVSKGSKGSVEGKGSKGGRKMMRTYQRKLVGDTRKTLEHDDGPELLSVQGDEDIGVDEYEETDNFASVPKDHDEGELYPITEHEEEAELLNEVVSDGCQEPEEEIYVTSKGKGGRRLLKEDMPRIHWAHGHHIIDMRADISAELEDGHLDVQDGVR